MDYDIIIIGSGVVGLAIAVSLCKENRSILVIEQYPSFGRETSSRNSEVIHAGIYYPKNSLKAKLCTAGNISLYEWCNKHSIPNRRIGKYIIAVNESEISELETVYKSAMDNGVNGIYPINKNKIFAEEPNIKAVAGLYSPSTGIVDSHKLMQSFEDYGKENGVDFAYNHSVTGIEKANIGYKIEIKSADGDKWIISSETVINSAGLQSDKVAELAGINVEKHNYVINYYKGHYFRLSPSLKGYVNHLIYPVPPKDLSYLGIHLTIELDGGLKLGPDIHFQNDRVIDYSVSDNLREKFFNSAREYIKGLKIDDIFPDQAGIRPKLKSYQGEYPDFIINEESQKKLPGLVNLIGIESPGLTSCLEIGKYVKDLLQIR